MWCCRPPRPARSLSPLDPPFPVCHRAGMPHLPIRPAASQRIVIVGGPRTGKSTLARELRLLGFPTLCGDPESKVKEVEVGVEYLPEGLPVSGDDGAAQWVADNWFTRPGPWCCEGWVMARALRRWGAFENQIHPRRLAMPCERIIVLRRQYQAAVTKAGQVAQHKGVFTVWDTISQYFVPITEYR